MGFLENLVIALIILVVVLYFAYYLSKRKLEIIEEKYSKLEHDYKGMSVKHGYQFESFVPFMDNYPGDKENTVFIGKPIDFISFDEDSVKFIEVKTGKSGLNENQRRIRCLIEDKKVEWCELRFEK